MSAGPVEIVEVGPRDGLQNEPVPVPLAAKVALIDALSAAGFRRIEAGAFVSARAVPQMAESGAVFGAIRRAPGVRYAALVPNLQGLEAALAAGADEVAVFASASDGFARANIRATVAESLDRLGAVAAAAVARGVPVRGYVSCITDCPYDGAVAPGAVARVAAALFAMGCYEVSLGDTIGAATPDGVAAVLAAVDGPPGRLAGHFHDTGGRALENAEAALAAGVRVFDASIAGLGGCPFAPGASGNVATEALAARLAALGYETGLDAGRLEAAAGLARRVLGVRA